MPYLLDAQICSPIVTPLRCSRSRAQYGGFAKDVDDSLLTSFVRKRRQSGESLPIGDDEDLSTGPSALGAEERMVGRRNRAPARMIEWSVLEDAGPLEFLGQGEFATAHACTIDDMKVAVKVSTGTCTGTNRRKLSHPSQPYPILPNPTQSYPTLPNPPQPSLLLSPRSAHLAMWQVLKTQKRQVTAAVRGLKREIMLMSMFTHPHILRAMALGHQDDSVPFVVLERLQCTLRQELPDDPDSVPFWVTWKQKRNWPLERAIDCGRQLASALEYCHSLALPDYCVLHRDIKPQNIGFMPRTPADPPPSKGRPAHVGRLVIFDFGLACMWKKSDEEDVLKKTEMRPLSGECGSLRYMAPEVALSQSYNHLAEVFSFATVLWEMCALKLPFAAFLEDAFKRALIAGFRPELKKK